MRTFLKTITTHLVLLGSLFISPGPAAAEGLQNAAGELRNTGRPAFGEQAVAEGTAENLPLLIGRFINIFLLVIGSVFFILMIYGGYTWMIARGDTEKVKKAKDLITDAIIGLVVIFAAYAISNFVVSRIVGATRLE